MVNFKDHSYFSQKLGIWEGTYVKKGKNYSGIEFFFTTLPIYMYLEILKFYEIEKLFWQKLWLHTVELGF